MYLTLFYRVYSLIQKELFRIKAFEHVSICHLNVSKCILYCFTFSKQCFCNNTWDCLDKDYPSIVDWYMPCYGLTWRRDAETILCREFVCALRIFSFAFGQELTLFANRSVYKFFGCISRRLPSGFFIFFGATWTHRAICHMYVRLGKSAFCARPQHHKHCCRRIKIVK